ncbi:50S ribosomal protein L10 [Sporolactobacillus inulinus]|uniref:Large ribosomal subunit protein uL10 n=1 Tax=Sporolactobacillus inulinus CASD TaxID=1069536 RepID=A0A0U1QNX8_9BACL|nr:50S ribosomal protein L10 [Sporolactobacillus inulinus]KLI02504.1 50S ribosomal protein L10 [Sporolactobacillus inulinus CASD]GEB77092.1 50S ribosomal protein L10 [Sporolactobacillus inulinus]
MSNQKILDQKKLVVDEIAAKLKESVATIAVNYRGLSVAEVTELRKQLREAGVDYKVYKNTFARRATEIAGLTDLDDALTGPTAISFSKDDVIAPAKVLYTFAKEHEALEIKAGVIEGKLTSLDEIKALAELPSREGLLSMLANVLQAPIRNIALGVKAVAEQKEQEA